MKLKLKAYSPLNNNWNLEYGTIVLKGDILLEFIENVENINFLKIKYGEQYFPIKPNTYTILFLNEINDYHKNFAATIRIKDSLLFYVKLNLIQKTILKWMLKKYDIQSKEMKMDFYKYLLGGVLGIISTIITQEVNQRYKADPETPPKAGIQKSLVPKNLIKRDK
ncbi:hypothetical protein FVB9288_02385 [Flavobacterium sp. CECT 9288]|uniref:hypothetical protein n=1 Tax=Flavobacterium sp. CECT 9288 TaxID=2845819 RepID=UPI001E545D7D|nr:hypothetical protein [Flavobacterium sp. CECT 9288]CAH0336674.1 hypothetical protein FVB9288_02385 [Flavobacterium sp. CECT 9288]